MPGPTPATVGPPQSWIAAAAQITPGFEVAGDPYLGVAGDFDGMGVSCGALQWNIGQGTLQPMVRAMGEEAVLAAMPLYGAQFWQACRAGIGDALGIVRAWHKGTTLAPAAAMELRTLMGQPQMRAEQDKALAKIAGLAFNRASAWARAAGRAAPTKREFVWFFDLVVQNGGLKGLTVSKVRGFIRQAGAVCVVCDFLAARPGRSGHSADARRNAALWRSAQGELTVELLAASYLRAKTASPKWRHVVINRKGVLAVGGGWVNGRKFDFRPLLAEG